MLLLKFSQLTSEPLIVGPCTLLLSYKLRTDAFSLAFAKPLCGDNLLLSIFIGLPSLVLTRTLAESYPSNSVVA